MISAFVWIITLVAGIAAYLAGKKIAERKFTDKPSIDKNMKKVMEDPMALAEKLRNINVALSDGRKVKIRKIIDNGAEVDYPGRIDQILEERERRSRQDG